MSALEKIIEWANELPEWQSDAVRRILSLPDFTEKDKKEIISYLKLKNGLIDDIGDTPSPKRIKGGEISGAPQHLADIKLKSIKCISGVNAIPDGSTIPISISGLNAIYGGNGSGKSGYARVLKKACNARDTEEDILNNIFDEVEKEIRADIGTNINGKNKTIKWELGKESEDELSNISVFDSKCARIIIDKKNNAQYLPYGTFVFEKLAEILESIKNQLEQEKPVPEKPLINEINITTKSGRFYEEFNINYKESELESKIFWNESNEEETKSLNREIINVESNDPVKQANKIKII